MNTACYLLLSLFSIFHIDEIAVCTDTIQART